MTTRLRSIGTLVIAALVSVATTAAAQGAESRDGCESPHIQAHLMAVERELLAADVSHLDPAQLARRAGHIQALAIYRERCEFPANTLARDRLVTVFVDDDDVHCAVGHLMRLDGEVELVDRIRTHRNTATIQELGDDPELLAWLSEAGLTVAEAMRIQPSYCFMNRGGTCLCQGPMGYQASGVAEGRIVAMDIPGSTIEVSITRVHGEGATPGDIRTVQHVAGDVIDRQVLVVLANGDGGMMAGRGPQVLGDGSVSCTSGSSAYEGQYCARVPSDVYVAALLSEDCFASLGAHDPALLRSVCDLGGAACNVDGLPVETDDDGCSGGEPSHLGLPLLLLLALRLGTGRRTMSLHVAGQEAVETDV